MSLLGLLCYLYWLPTYCSSPGTAPQYKTLNFTTKHGLTLSWTVLPPSELPGQWGGAGRYVGARHEDSAGGRTQYDAQPWSPLNVRNQGNGLFCSLLHIINLQAGVEPARPFHWQRWPVRPRGFAAGTGQYCGHLVKLCRHNFRNIRIIKINHMLHSHSIHINGRKKKEDKNDWVWIWLTIFLHTGLI